MQYSTIAIFIVVHTIHYFLQLFRIFRLLGTPNEAIWPGVTHLQDFNSSFPNWDAPTEFANILPDLKVIFVEHVFIKMNRYEEIQFLSSILITLKIFY